MNMFIQTTFILSRGSYYVTNFTQIGPVKQWQLDYIRFQLTFLLESLFSRPNNREFDPQSMQAYQNTEDTKGSWFIIDCKTIWVRRTTHDCSIDSCNHWALTKDSNVWCISEQQRYLSNNSKGLLIPIKLGSTYNDRYYVLWKLMPHYYQRKWSKEFMLEGILKVKSYVINDLITLRSRVNLIKTRKL